MKKIVIAALVIIFGISCLQPNKKSITVLKGCESNEAISDIELSIKNNETFLKQNGIEIKYSQEKCGYTLINGKKEKLIEGAITDVGLFEEVKEFYNIK